MSGQEQLLHTLLDLRGESVGCFRAAGTISVPLHICENITWIQDGPPNMCHQERRESAVAGLRPVEGTVCDSNYIYELDCAYFLINNLVFFFSMVELVFALAA